MKMDVIFVISTSKLYKINDEKKLLKVFILQSRVICAGRFGMLRFALRCYRYRAFQQALHSFHDTLQASRKPGS